MTSNTPQSGDSPENEDNDEILRRVREFLYPETEVHAQSGAIEHVSAESRKKLHQISSQPHRSFPPEKIERLRRLEPRFLKLDERCPEISPDLLQMERVYTQNLVPDEAFIALENKDIFKFEQEVRRGGMLNRFKPDLMERENYPDDYESVRDQIINDLLPDPANPELSRSGRPGKYYVRGLFDGDMLRAYLSFRVPPHPSDFSTNEIYEEQMKAYKKHLEKILFDPELVATGQMQYESYWNPEKTLRQLPSLWELDTYSVESGWGGAAAILTRDVLQFVKDRYGAFPAGMYCYRFKGLPYVDDESGQTLPQGENRASRIFLEDIGFRNMATRYAKADVVWRHLRYDDECHMYKPGWQFMYNGPNNIQQYLKAYMVNRGLLKPDESLIS